MAESVFLLNPVNIVNCTNKHTNSCTYSTQLRPGGSNTVKHKPKQVDFWQIYEQPWLSSMQKRQLQLWKSYEVKLGYIIKYIILNALLQSLCYLVSYCTQ